MYGVSPDAYVIDRLSDVARQLPLGGVPPNEVALADGFTSTVSPRAVARGGRRVDQGPRAHLSAAWDAEDW
jgi:hypothetical protein